MYAKSFLALDGNGRLTGARTAQRYPYDRYTCHLCGSALQYHPDYDAGRPYLEHRSGMLTDNGRQYCPYVRPEPGETRHIRKLKCYIPDARSLVYRNDWLNGLDATVMSLAWYCVWCANHYSGEKRCTACGNGIYSIEEACWQNNYTRVGLLVGKMPSCNST
ncbi:putative zinc ribbon protein [Enterobacter asburiae]|uniref:putative zinc ribbon protein n=1 Tax=Enterobacter asburiae TaxID=61645 RepID=UPI0009081BFB|nr:putative zinc ribbon protein [Enterobacter asburiae]